MVPPPLLCTTRHSMATSWLLYGFLCTTRHSMATSWPLYGFLCTTCHSMATSGRSMASFVLLATLWQPPGRSMASFVLLATLWQPPAALWLPLYYLPLYGNLRPLYGFLCTTCHSMATSWPLYGFLCTTCHSMAPPCCLATLWPLLATWLLSGHYLPLGALFACW